MLGLARHLTLRQRLLAIVALSVVPAVGALGYFILAIHQEREHEVREQALRTSELAALEIGRIITGADGILKTLALAPSVRHLATDCDVYLEEVAAQLPQLRGFVVADPDGRVRCASGFSFGPGGVSGQSWFQPALAGSDFVVGEYTRAQPDGAAYLPVAIATGREGRPGVVMTGIDLAWLGTLLRERTLTPGNALAVADRNGILIAREPDPDRFVGTSIPETYRSLVDADRPGTTEVMSQDGTRRILGYQPVRATGIGLYVSAGFSTEAAFAPIYASTWRSLALAAAGAIAALSLVWSVGDQLIRRPIRRILDTIASWRAGDESARTGIRADGSEIAALGGSIDEYMDSLAAVRAERAAAEEHRTLLLREMNHRIKNLLAAVQAIANQTFKGQATAESMRLFGSRLSAMAAAHDLLVSHNWESADLRRTVEAALAPFGLDRAGRFILEGPPLRITARASMALSMALHELCTNAVKYGSLGAPAGQVAIRWGVAGESGAERFRFNWTESGGPRVTTPGRRGFGTRMIESALAGELAGRADLDFAAAGLSFSLDTNATTVLASTAAPEAGTTAA